MVKPDSDGNLNPAIASDYTVSEDKKTFTFTLRENVKFHDGSLVTAEDVKYSIDRCAGAEDGTPLVAAFSNISQTTILDEKTVEICPDPVDSLTYAEASYRFPAGVVRVRWEREGDGILLRVEAPEGVTVRYNLPENVSVRIVE